MAEADIAVEELRGWLDKCRKEKDNIAREEQIQFETKLFETRMKYETELASAKVKALNTIPQNAKGESQQNIRAKLPKLVISKFHGDFQDWQRFWGQFIETIDKTTMPPITKFTYLCELLDPKIKHIVDSLPFTARAIIGQNPSSKIILGKNRKLSRHMSKIYWTCHISQTQTQRKFEISVSV